MSRSLIKIAVAAVLVAALAFYFVRSVKDARAEPYSVAAVHLRGWTLALESAPQPNAPLLVLRPPEEFAAGLFNQVFARAMESMKGLTSASVPVVLAGEFQAVLASSMTPEALLASAREARLDQAPFTPRCLAVRRVSEPGSTRQVYFVIFDAPEFGRFREQLAAQSVALASGSGIFDAAALSPVLIVGGTDANLFRWLPIRAAPDTDCVAPISITG